MPDALKATDEALTAAVKGEDRVGQLCHSRHAPKSCRIWRAMTRRWRNGSWQRTLGRHSAARLARSLALVRAGLLYAPDKNEEAGKLFSQGLSIAKADTQYPDAIAHALFDSGVLLAQGHNESGQRPIKDFVGSYARLVKNPIRQPAWDYLGAALAIQEKQSSGSMELAKPLNFLAQVRDRLAYGASGADSDKYVVMEKDYAARSVEIVRRLAPVRAVGVSRKDKGPPDSHDSDSSGPTPLSPRLPLTRTPP